MGLMKILFLPLQLTAKSPAASLPISYKYMAWDLDLFNNSAALLSSLRLLPKASLEDGVNTEWGTQLLHVQIIASNWMNTSGRAHERIYCWWEFPRLCFFLSHLSYLGMFCNLHFHSSSYFMFLQSAWQSIMRHSSR